MRGPVVAYTSFRCIASKSDARVFSSARTATSPAAPMSHPRVPGMTSSDLLSGVESSAILPWKLSSSAEDMAVCESVEPIIPNL